MSGIGNAMRRRRRRLGISHVELLVAGMLLSIGLAASIKLWVFAYNITTDTDNVGISYNLGRQALENVRNSGFANAAEGATVTYYSGTPTLLGSAAGATYQVTTTITSSAVSSGTAGVAGAVPASTALRTVVVTVVRTSDAATVLYQTTTYLANGGI